MTFKEQKEYIEKHKKIDMRHFRNVTEITQMLDFLNQQREDKLNQHAEREITEISKFLANIQGRKMFFLGNK